MVDGELNLSVSSGTTPEDFVVTYREPRSLIELEALRELAEDIPLDGTRFIYPFYTWKLTIRAIINGDLTAEAADRARLKAIDALDGNAHVARIAASHTLEKANRRRGPDLERIADNTASSPAAAEILATALERHLAQLHHFLHDEERLSWNNTLTGRDESFAQYLEELGERGKVEGADVLKTINRQWTEYTRRRETLLPEKHEAGKLLRTWLDPILLQGPILGNAECFIHILARVLWADVVEPNLTPEDLARPLKTPTAKGYAKLPKMTSAVSWTFGGKGVTGIELDGDRYDFEPSIVRDVAEGRALLPKSHPLVTPQEAPHRALLPIGLGEKEESPLPIAMAEANAGGLLGVPATKVLLLAMADPTIWNGDLVKTSVNTWTKRLNPGKKRIQARDRRAVGKAFKEAAGLHVYNPVSGNAPRMFEIAPAVRRLIDGTLDPTAEIWIGFSKTFELAWKECFSADTYRGEFMLNLSGVLRLDGRRPAPMRHYIRAAAGWNAAFDPHSKAFAARMLPARTIDELAAMANALSPAVVEYLEANAKGRKKIAHRKFHASHERKRARDDLEYLDGEGLIVLERVGPDKYKVLPPDDYLEAWRLARKTGCREENG